MAIKEDYISIHTGIVIDAAISAVIAGRAGLQGVYLNGTELTPDSSNKVSISLTGDYYNKTQIGNLLDSKVDKVEGKGLSTEDFTSTDKTKLSGIETEANKTIVVQGTGDSITNVMSQNAVTTQLNSKADSSSLSTVATSGSYSDLTNKPTKLSDFTNDGIFITNAVNDLVNYYTKSETYTKSQIDNLVSIIPKFDVEVVNQLPTTDISETTIYLVPSSSETSGMYKEYIYVNNNWELLGTQTFDITDYYTKTQIDSLLGDKVDKVTGKGLSTEDFTTADQQKLSGIETEANKTIVVQSTGNSTTSVMSQDAVTLQLNTKATVSYYTATLSSSSWSASTPYTQTLNVTGILSTDKPVVDLSAPTASNLESWGLVASVQSGSGTLTFTCYDGVPTENLDLNIMVVR